MCDVSFDAVVSHSETPTTQLHENPSGFLLLMLILRLGGC
jgi:hypothetical protein